jgi:hypothetical protein
VRSCAAKVVLIVLGLFLFAPASRAALLSYEGFDYPSGSSIVGQNGGIGFTQPWQLNSSQGVFTNQGFSLAYTDPQSNRLLTIGGSLLIQGLTNGDFAAQPNRLLSYSRGTNTSGTDGVSTWISFLVVRQGPTTNSVTNVFNPYPRSANLSLYNNVPSNTEKLAMGNTALTPSNNVALLPQGSINNIRTSAVNYSHTNFIVVRIDHVAGAALDNAYLFVNPPLATEPPLSAADTNSIGQFDFSFNRIRPFAGGNRPSAESPYAELVLDEIRIGETYADVAPYIPPLFVSLSGGDAALTWSGTNAHLQAAGDVDGPYTNIVGATSPFTNNLPDPRHFFRLSSQ